MEIANLPLGETDKQNWPWRKLSEPDHNPNCEVSAWPRITIITPSYNQGQFLEETIRSVLLQGYPNLEYMVIDGGSTDNSVEIIKKYAPWIDYWVSEPDRGQAHAINKGFARCTGDIVGWINSDDLLLPGALAMVADGYRKNPGSVILGDVINFVDGTNKKKLIRQKNVSFNALVTITNSRQSTWHQPGTFVPVTLFKPQNILLDESFRYYFDMDWMCRILRNAQVVYLHQPVAMFREHPNSKTIGERTKWLPETEIVVKRYWNEVPGLNKNKVDAFLDLSRSAILLGKATWDRPAGYEYINKALKLYPQYAFSPLCIELLLRCLLPRQFLLWLRARLADLNIRFVN